MRCYSRCPGPRQIALTFPSTALPSLPPPPSTVVALLQRTIANVDLVITDTAPPKRPPDPPNRSTKPGGKAPGQKVLAGPSGTGTSKPSPKRDGSSTLGNLAVTPGTARGQAGAPPLPPVVSGNAVTSVSSQISTMSSGSSAASGSSNVGTESSSQQPSLSGLALRPRSPASLFGSFAFEKFHKKAPPAPKPAAPAGKTPEVTLVDVPLPTSRPWSEDSDLPKITPDLKEIQRLEKEQSDQVMQQQKTQRNPPADDPVHCRVRRNATGNMAYRGTSDGVKKQKTKYKESGRDLQNILMGLSVPFVEQHSAWWDSDIVSPQNLQLAEDYIASAGFNTSQQACLNDIFRTTNLLTLTQGPPGTGKSATAGGASVVANVLNKHVLGTAPTNTAAGQMLRHCIAERRKLRKVEGGTERADQTALVYLPSMVQTKEFLQMEGSKTDSTHFYNHFVELKERDSLDTMLSEDNRNLALQWLKALKFIRGGGKLSPEELDVYLKVVDTEWKRVFDEARGPMTVITTSNNAHMLAMYTKWKPDLCIVDEAALGMEGDSLIPLSMRPTRVFLVGDHKKPIILSADQNEYSDQAETSLFKRLVDCGLHCYRLEINYHMHWRNSLFPAAITYDHLDNGARQTLEEEQQTEVEVEDDRVEARY